jgi:hypothetical protein
MAPFWREDPNDSDQNKKRAQRRAHDLENQARVQGRVQLKDSVWIQIKITKIRNSNQQIKRHFIVHDIFSAGLHTRKKEKKRGLFTP